MLASFNSRMVCCAVGCFPSGATWPATPAHIRTSLLSVNSATKHSQQHAGLSCTCAATRENDRLFVSIADARFLRQESFKRTCSFTVVSGRLAVLLFLMMACSVAGPLQTGAHSLRTNERILASGHTFVMSAAKDLHSRARGRAMSANTRARGRIRVSNATRHLPRRPVAQST